MLVVHCAGLYNYINASDAMVTVVYATDRSKAVGPVVILILCAFVFFTARRFMLCLTLLHVLMFFQSYLSLRSPRLENRELVCMLLVHLNGDMTKPTKKNCAPSEASDHPGHPPSLIRTFAVRMKKAWVLSDPLSASEDSDQTGLMPSLI